jgi:hypothetical protein
MCGMELSYGAAECSNCGYKLPEEMKKQQMYEQQQFTQQQYAQPVYNQQQMYGNLNENTFKPRISLNKRLKTNRNFIKFILLSLITGGIYSIYYFWAIGSDINTIAGRYDGRKTMNFCLNFFLLGPITGYIATIVWYHCLSDRIGIELRRRGIDYSFGVGTFWGWFMLGSLIAVGPCVYVYKLNEAMNLLSDNYNVRG